MTNVIPFHTRMRAIEEQKQARAPSMFELYWVKGSEVCSLSCSNGDQIRRQMDSLARRRIAASVYENGFPAGYVGPGPGARNNGPFQSFFYDSQIHV